MLAPFHSGSLLALALVVAAPTYAQADTKVCPDGTKVDVSVQCRVESTAYSNTVKTDKTTGGGNGHKAINRDVKIPSVKAPTVGMTSGADLTQGGQTLPNSVDCRQNPMHCAGPTQ